MQTTPDALPNPEQMQPLRDRDATAPADPAEDAAQAEWERTAAADEAAEDGVPDDPDDVPAEDLPGTQDTPESQGVDPVTADLGEDGEGDLTPEDM